MSSLLFKTLLRWPLTKVPACTWPWLTSTGHLWCLASVVSTWAWWSATDSSVETNEFSSLSSNFLWPKVFTALWDPWSLGHGEKSLEEAQEEWSLLEHAWLDSLALGPWRWSESCCKLPFLPLLLSFSLSFLTSSLLFSLDFVYLSHVHYFV